MKPLKALTGTIENFPGLYLNILLTDEDEMIVARCLDFSVSSHGKDEQDALVSLSDSIADYLDHALQHGAFDAIIDPEGMGFGKFSESRDFERNLQ
ncbi:MAG TPA: hypothetical protein ENK58_09310 [Desulfobacterales bacterium]|nr:hypothetical protein [Desulfobacterales bacterium]